MDPALPTPKLSMAENICFMRVHNNRNVLILILSYLRELRLKIDVHNFLTPLYSNYFIAEP